MAILEDAAIVYKSLLRSDFVAQKYLKEVRGIAQGTSDFFGLGASGNPGDFYRIMSIEGGYTDEELEASGLMKFNGDPLERFFNSVIIPIRDISGNVINLSSRKYDDGKMKYINLPNMPLVDFFGVEVVANRHSYTKYPQLGEYVIIAEGQFDTMTLQQSGYPAMGIMGVHNIRENMFKHFEWFDSVVLCMDNDGPGEKATDNMASYIRHFYPSMRIFKANLGEHNDANDFFLSGKKPSQFNKTLTPVIGIKPKPLKSKKRHYPTTRSDDVIEDIKDIDIVEFISSINPTIKWRQVDNLEKTECPFSDHNDTVASFTVYTNNNTYYCWGCGRGGDVIDFCNNFFDTKFKESVKILKDWCNR